MNTSVLMMAGLLVALPGFAAASTPIDETRAIAADGWVQVENVAGSIEITAWDRNEVHVTGELGEDVEELEITESSRGVTIRVRNREHQRRIDESHLFVRVPVKASVIAEGVSADVTASGLDGGELEFSTVSGDVQVEANTRRLELESVSGDVTFRGHTANVSAESVSGDVELEGVEGEVRAKTVSGDVTLEGGTIAVGRFESVSGSLELMLEVADGGRLKANSMSGDIRLGLPAGQQGDFSARTFSGDIRSEFGSVAASASGPGRRLDHHEGDDGASIEVESFSGDVRIVRR